MRPSLWPDNTSHPHSLEVAYSLTDQRTLLSDGGLKALLAAAAVTNVPARTYEDPFYVVLGC